MNKIFCLLIMFLSFYVSPVFAFGPPSYLPDGAHPRIWLTNEVLADLNAKQDANAPEWQALFNWCEAHLGDPGYDQGTVGWRAYRMGGYYKYLMNFALAAQVLKDDNPAKAKKYAEYARNILIDGIAVGLRAGEENNGLAALRCGETLDVTTNSAEASVLGIGKAAYKQGYSARYLTGVAVAYDWLFDTLSEEDKVTIREMLYRWFDWIQGFRSNYNNGVLVSGSRYHEDTGGLCTGINNCSGVSGTQKGYSYGNIANNFFSGEFSFMALVPLVTYGDSPDADDYLKAMRDLYDNSVKVPLQSPTGHNGGDSVEGWNYGSSYFRLLASFYAVQVATGENLFSTFSWPQELLKANIHRLAADFKSVPIYGEWTGIPLGEDRRYSLLTFAGLNQRLYPNAIESKVGQYLLNNVAHASNSKPAEWEELLWYNPDFEEINPGSSDLPLFYQATGNGLVTTRSSWNNAIDTVFASVRLEGKMTTDHEVYDEGHISLMRGSDRLLTHQNMVRSSLGHNTVVFNDDSHHANNPPMGSPAIDRLENGNDYLYVSGDITNAYKRIWKNDKARLFRRSLLHLRPNLLVVFDTTQSNPDVGLGKAWYANFAAEPAIEGNTTSITIGKSRAFIQAVFPADGRYTKTNPAAGFWRVGYKPPVEQEYDQFLHTIEAVSTDQDQMTPVEGFASSNGNMRGVYIQHNSAPRVVLFSSIQTGGDVAGDISYTVEISQTNKPQHILLGLLPNTKYNVTVTGDKVFDIKVDPNGGYVASAQGVLTFQPPEAEKNSWKKLIHPDFPWEKKGKYRRNLQN